MSPSDFHPGPLSLARDCRPLPLRDLAIYCHIPFCEARCRYCSFHFETTKAPVLIQRTLDTMKDEARFMASLFEDSGLPLIRTLYLGGGTPSLVAPFVLDTFLGSLAETWKLKQNPPVEWTMEANPESLDQGHLAVMARHGVNRLSLGCQSLDDRLLALMGRRAREADIHRCLVLLARARKEGLWQGQIGFDLMVGLPGQDQPSLDRDLDILLDRQADHFSVYQLTVEEQTALESHHRTGTLDLDGQWAEDLWFRVEERLEAAGYRHYETSNYALPGRESLHNQGYWRMEPYIGIGPGAVGTLVCRHGPGEEVSAVRLTNPGTLAYSRRTRRGWEHQTEVISPRDWLFEHFIMGLRTLEGVDVVQALARCGFECSAWDQALARLGQQWQAAGWFDPDRGWQAGRLVLAPRGRLFLDRVLADIAQALDEPAFRPPDRP